MYREPRSQVTQNENNRTIIFDELTEMYLQTFKQKIRAITKNPFTEQQAEEFAYCIIGKFLDYRDDIVELEDFIEEMAETATDFEEILKGGGTSEQ